jgi:predicted nucleotidyltransferase
MATEALDPRIVAHLAGLPIAGARIIVAANAGSEGHGTRDPAPNSIDDVDVLGAYLPPPFLIGLKQTEHWTAFIDELDVTFYTLHKLVALWLRGNPNVLGLLWLPERHYLVRTEFFDAFRRHRRIFASRTAYEPFRGYGRA